jgi:hypothetical protein
LVLAPISVGELFDKITILRVKAARINDAAKLANVQTELAELERIVRENNLKESDFTESIEALQAINGELWDIEDAKRDCERKQEFGARFIELARSVYIKNDCRAAIKRTINNASGSNIVEEKSHRAY